MNRAVPTMTVRTRNSLQNATTTPRADLDRFYTPPILEEQAQNLVLAMEYWNELVEYVWCRDSYHREQIEELSRLYRRADRVLRRLCFRLGRTYAIDVPQWVDDYYTYP